MKPYRSVFSREAWRSATEADDAAFRELEAWVDRIERAPATAGDFSERDGDGRELQVVALDRVVITYWPDHAVREVRVVRIEPL